MNEGIQSAEALVPVNGVYRGPSFHTASSSMADMDEESKEKVGGEHRFKKGASFHDTASTTFSKSPSESPIDIKEAKMASCKVPQLPMPVSKDRSKSNRPTERKRPKQRPPLESTLERHHAHQGHNISSKTSRESRPQDTLTADTKNTMQVIDLLWRDLRGVEGKYSGQINSWIQPHGFGSLVLVDGTTITCKWYNGTPLDRRRSDSGYNRNESLRRSSTSRRSSEGNEEREHRAPIDESSRTVDNKFDYVKSVSEPVVSSTPRGKQLSRRHTYQLGDVPVSSKHMIASSSMKDAIENASTLNIHDFAFVLRSNGDWCYSIVARKNPPSESMDKRGKIVTDYEDASILFVTDTKGSTKSIKMKHWGKMIRLVNL